MWFPSAHSLAPSFHQGSLTVLTQRSPPKFHSKNLEFKAGRRQSRAVKIPSNSRRNVNEKHLPGDAFYSIYIITLTEVNCILIVAG